MSLALFGYLHLITSYVEYTVYRYFNIVKVQYSTNDREKENA